MTVQELMERLSHLSPDAEVRVAQPSHNRWRHVVASEVESADEVEVVYSAYNEEFIVLKDDSLPDDNAERKNVVVIS